ncbi:cysteine desulfurase family protein [Atopobacter phocae]|uniref:cysteine desulfurase family protein n=1 Tax=Atopobacter phocae TaxID=136492 RepID=UPI00046F95FF|nr:cysteine desulfurase family protein [Atopobacter phocae]
MYYFDHAATTPVSEDVADTISSHLKNSWLNPSAIYQGAKSTKRIMQEAIAQMALDLNVAPEQIIITSGATESNNSVFHYILERYKTGHVIISSVEHPSVLNGVSILKDHGFDVTFLKVDSSGLITAEDVIKALRPDTRLVSIMTVNNETGVRFPIKSIHSVLKNKINDQGEPILFHTDSVQAINTMAIDLSEWGVDFASFSGHKFNAPKGIGILYVKEPHRFIPIMRGGSQQQGRRAGTENLPYIVGLAQALHTVQSTVSKSLAHYKELGDILINGLEDHGLKQEIDFLLNGHQGHHSPHIWNISFNGIQASQWMILSDLKHIAISAGSACSAGSLQNSPVLLAMFGENNPRVNEAIRISFGRETTQEEVKYLVDFLASEYKRIKKW